MAGREQKDIGKISRHGSASDPEIESGELMKKIACSICGYPPPSNGSGHRVQQFPRPNGWERESPRGLRHGAITVRRQW